MNKTVLITGSAKRIGADIAVYLHGLGFRVVIHCYKSTSEGQKLVDYFNAIRSDSAKLVVADLHIEQSIESIIDETITWANQLDVLVNNASVFSRVLDNWEEMFLINVKVPFLLSTNAYSHLAKTKGSIINITDTHANTPLKGYAIYCQTKSALLMQTKSLAIEFSPSVRVNAVAPGAILWPTGDNALNSAQQQSIIAQTPLKRHGDSLFIAKAVFSLIDNEFVTGQELRVDGGRNI
ncbi:MAG: pteridine reductase [Legionellaceae bacterium]|nr:pteridine reductase [Legionellaceae bacterium]